QVDVHVNQAGADDLSRRVEGVIGVEIGSRADGEDAIALQPEIGDLVEILARIDDPAGGNAQGVHGGDCSRWARRSQPESVGLRSMNAHTSSSPPRYRAANFGQRWRIISSVIVSCVNLGRTTLPSCSYRRSYSATSSSPLVSSQAWRPRP